MLENNVGCAADLVHPDRNGWIFRAGDVADLTRCLQDAFGDRDRLKTFGLHSQAIVQEYCYENAWRGIQSALMALASPHNNS